MNAYKVVTATCFLLASSLSGAADWFKIEVIVFANNDTQGISAEYWEPINQIPEKNSRVLKPVDSTNIQSYQRLPGNYLNLHQERKLLNGSGKYRVLMHRSWMQPVAKTQNPRPIRIRAGEVLDNGMYELEGYIGVGRGRYLHFRPDLYFSKRLSSSEESLLKQPATTKNKASNATETLANIDSLTPSTSSSAAAASFTLDLPEILTVNLNQARRMRSKEVHYIDHPLFGVVVEMTPIE